MSKITLFQTALRSVAATYTMQGLARMSGLPRGNLTSYASGRSRPPPDALEAICRVLTPHERAPLVLAHLLDECPGSVRPELILELRPDLQQVTSALSSADADSLDAVFAALRHLAETRPEVREWLQESLRLIR
jgi:hypothetical protein